MLNEDSTIEDNANAAKPVHKLQKSSVSAPSTKLTRLTYGDYDVIQETNEYGTPKLVFIKNIKNLPETNAEEESFSIYPEIVWYLISKFIKPEDVGRFAGINKITYAITKRESFWRSLYSKYCDDQSKLPDYLRLDINPESYGLRQRVIRALYHLHQPFRNKVMRLAEQASGAHHLLKRCCVGMWSSKGPRFWLSYFKFKKRTPMYGPAIDNGADIIEDLKRVNVNSDKDCQVLQITTEKFFVLPPIVGLTLSFARLELVHACVYNRLHLGFYGVSHADEISPEFSVVVDTVRHTVVYDWWHPKYPHFEYKIPSNTTD